MSFRTMVVALAAVSVLSGCASLALSQDLQRLQSQVALVDERVTQLERVSTRTPIAAATSQTSTSGTTQTAEEPKQTQRSAPAERTRVVFRPATSDIQQALQDAGHFKGAVDGKMGPVTREAIREFQRMNGLQVDGIVGNKTWSKLSTHVDTLAGGEIKTSDTLN